MIPSLVTSQITYSPFPPGFAALSPNFRIRPASSQFRRLHRYRLYFLPFFCHTKRGKFTTVSLYPDVSPEPFDSRISRFGRRYAQWTKHDLIEQHASEDFLLFATGTIPPNFKGTPSLIQVKKLASYVIVLYKMVVILKSYSLSIELKRKNSSLFIFLKNKALYREY